jgi:hypothetical protein
MSTEPDSTEDSVELERRRPARRVRGATLTRLTDYSPLLHPYSKLRESSLTAHITPWWPSSLGAPAPSLPLASAFSAYWP